MTPDKGVGMKSTSVLAGRGVLMISVASLRLLRTDIFTPAHDSRSHVIGIRYRASSHVIIRHHMPSFRIMRIAH